MSTMELQLFTKDGNKQYPEHVVMCVTRRNFPNGLMNSNELQVVHNNILERIIDDDKVKPKFVEIKKMRGWLELTCADTKTSEWLKGAVSLFRIYRQCDYRYYMAKEKCKISLVLVEGCLTDSEYNSKDKILKFLQAQNDLRTTNWNITELTCENSILKLLILMDEESALKIDQVDGQVNYKFGQGKLKILDRDAFEKFCVLQELN